MDPDVTGKELERFILAELRTLPEDRAETVAKHLVMVARLLESDPARALEHGVRAKEVATRVGVVRETLGTAAYAAGDFGLALSELKAARRINGSMDFIAMMADCERGLGRPERALDLIASITGRLPSDTAVELLIVEAGARRDLGDVEAAVLVLQRPELRSTTDQPWLARLRYAYADALLAAGRTADAQTWFAAAAAADRDGTTAAAERLAELTGYAVISHDGGIEIGDASLEGDEPEDAALEGDEPEDASLEGDGPATGGENASAPGVGPDTVPERHG